MHVSVVLDARFDQAPDGSVWTPSQYARPFFTRYLEVFEQVRVVARVRPVAQAPAGWKQADGGGVSFVAVPYFMGPGEFLRRIHQVAPVMRRAGRSSEAIILRAPSLLGDRMAPTLTRMGHPYGLEVIGDPWDVFAPGAMAHPLRRFFRVWFWAKLRRQCARACATAYVTRHALQRRYPSGPGAYSTNYSDVELGDDAFVNRPRMPPAAGKPVTLIMVGTLAQLYKGPDLLIDALAVCIQCGLDLRLVFVGDGRYRPALEARTRTLGLARRVHFAGELPEPSLVRAQLDKADLFVLPSRTEGLPRAMIEAMARALPCIGSDVGGIPELLSPEDRVPPGSADLLADKLMTVVRDRPRLGAMSQRNLTLAGQYHDTLLRKTRLQFYEHLRTETTAWLASRPRSA